MGITNLRITGSEVLYDPCVREFAGTSFAAPTVSGIAALMLEANPNLGWRDVQDILAYSALPNFKDVDNSLNTAKNSNGGGLLFNSSDGFGHVDAHGAVRLAETWDNTNTMENYKNLQYNMPESFHLIKATGKHGFDFEIGQDIEVEHVGLKLDFTDMKGKSLDNYRINLLSPEDENGNRTVVKMLDRPGSSCDGLKNVYCLRNELYTQHFRGVDSKGTWTIEFNNSMEISLDNLSVNVAGKPAGVREMIYTDTFCSDDFTEFLESKSKNKSESTHADNYTISSGYDAINTAAVTSDVSISLASNEAIIGGKHVTLSNDNEISRIKTGDGDDVIIGDNEDNWFLISRGNNTIGLGEGDNTLSLLHPLWSGLGMTKIYDFKYGSDHIEISKDFDLSSITYETSTRDCEDVIREYVDSVFPDTSNEDVEEVLATALRDLEAEGQDEVEILTLHIGNADLELYEVDHFDPDLMFEFVDV